MRFWLLSALGNRFVVIPVAKHPSDPVLAGVARVCDPGTGLGADGVAFVNTRRRYLHIYNADGGRAEVSGNGARCAAAWWFRHRSRRATSVAWKTDAGEVECAKSSDDAVAVTLPPPSFAAADIPAAVRSAELWGEKLKLGSKDLPAVTIYALSVGNPQAVVWSARFPGDWRRIGAAIEGHRVFPERTNVVFARKAGTSIEVRIWERGASETASSGTGASAAAIVGARRGLTRRTIKVEMPGGTMRVQWLTSGKIKTTCAVTEIASGHLAEPLELSS